MALSPVQFAVVKFVPDAIRDEPINVGIIGGFDGRLCMRMTPKFARIRREARVADTKALEIALRFLQSALDRQPNLTLLEVVSSLDRGILRVGEPTGGLADDPLEFIDDLYDRYVGDTPTTRMVSTTRRTIRERLRHALASRGTDSDRYAISRKRFVGATGRHDFDFGFENGAVTLMRGISLQTDESYALREARELCFAAVDSHKKESDIDRAVEVIAVVAPPLEGSAAYEEAEGLLRSNVDRYVVIDSAESNAEIDRVLQSRDLHPLTPDLLADPVTV